MEGPLLIWIALCALYLLVLLFLRVVYIQVCISKVVVTPLHTCTYVSSVNLDANLYHEYLPLQSSFHCHFGSLIVSFVVVIIITFPICICLSCLTSNIKEDISIWQLINYIHYHISILTSCTCVTTFSSISWASQLPQTVNCCVKVVVQMLYYSQTNNVVTDWVLHRVSFIV